MAIGFEEFMAATNAELCGDRIIVGVMADRKFVGDIVDGTFSLNEDGKAILAEMEARATTAKEAEISGAAKRGRKAAVADISLDDLE